MDGKIHRLVIHHDEEEYRWSVDEDYTNYTFLCTDICQDVLGNDYGVRTVSLTITGFVKGYENSFIVKDDASWMSSLGKNVENENNVIHLFVNIEEFLTNEVSPPKLAKCGPSCTITEIDEDASKANNGQAIILYTGKEETKLLTTIVISDSESDDFLVTICFPSICPLLIIVYNFKDCFSAKIEDYVDRYFTTDVWRRSLVGVVYPVPSRIYWPQFLEDAMLQPALPRKMASRPRVHRTRKEGDKMLVTTRANTVTCKLCKQTGHNKRGCAQNTNKGKNKLSVKRKFKKMGTTSSSRRGASSTSRPAPPPTKVEVEVDPMPQSQLTQEDTRLTES